MVAPLDVLFISIVANAMSIRVPTASHRWALKKDQERTRWSESGALLQRLDIVDVSHNLTGELTDDFPWAKLDWMQKAVSFLAARPCIEKGRQPQEVKTIRQVMRLDYMYNVLETNARETLFKDANTSLFRSLLDKVAPQVGRLLTMGQEEADREMLQSLLHHLNQTYCEGAQEDSKFCYEEVRDACISQETRNVAQLYDKMVSELVGPCVGTANRLYNTCAVDPEKALCPEGSYCGMISQTSGVVQSSLTYGLTVGLLFVSLGLSFGFPVAAAMPGQLETASLITAFATTYNHQCTCIPTACVWSSKHEACVTNKFADQSNSVEGVLAALPLAGFKCVLTGKACELTLCDTDDYTVSGVLSGDVVRGPKGILGVNGTASYNCWGRAGSRNIDMGPGDRVLQAMFMRALRPSKPSET